MGFSKKEGFEPNLGCKECLFPGLNLVDGSTLERALATEGSSPKSKFRDSWNHENACNHIMYSAMGTYVQQGVLYSDDNGMGVRAGVLVDRNSWPLGMVEVC